MQTLPTLRGDAKKGIGIDVEKGFLPWLTVLLLAVAAAWPLSVRALGSGALQGQIDNGTTGGRVAPGLEVTLRIYGADGSEETNTAQTDAEGGFSFTELPTAESNVYQVTVEYHGVSYQSEVLSFAAGQDMLTTEITVYETTERDAALSIEHAHLVLQFAADGLAVTEMLVVRNDGDSTYVGHGPEVAEGKTATLRFPLPPGAELINVGESLMRCCVVPTTEGFADTMPILPGARTVFYGYTLPYQGGALELRKAFTYPSDGLDILVGDQGMEVDVPGFSEVGLVETSAGTYRQWTSEGLTAGEQVVIRLQDMSLQEEEGPEPVAVAQQAVGWVLVIAAIILLAMAYPLWRRWRALPEMVEVDDEAREALLERVADLDNALEAGKIPETEYQIERAVLKRRLLDLWNQDTKIEEDSVPSEEHSA